VRPTGGQDRYALELARRLAGAVDLDIVTIRAEGGLPASVRVLTVWVPDRPLLLTAPLFRRAAHRLVSRERYDVVHTIGGALPGASVITAQFCAAEWRRLNRAATPYQRLVSAQAVRDERWAYGHPHLRAVIAVSRRTAEEVQRHYGPLGVPVHVVPNAVDQVAFAPASATRLPGGRRRLLFVGAFDRKGLDTAVRALALMKADAELVAIGNGDPARYGRLASELGIAGRLRLERPRKNIASAFSDADAFLFPTRYEPFGMVIAEALASGLPVITSACAGAAELIEPGLSGHIIHDPEDAAAFAAAADAILSDDARHQAMAVTARMAVRDLTWDMVADRTLDVYRAVAAGSTS
jgi:UDP-glucose:(heptosyl)LPS alpha-1,3-glucosyltransferase